LNDGVVEFVKANKLAMRMCAVAFVGATIVAYASLRVHNLIHLPRRGSAIKQHVSIPKGASAREVAERVYDNWVDRWLLLLAAKAEGVEQQLKHGDYAFDGTMSPQAMLDMLVEGARAPGIPVTFPEGMTFEQMAELLDNRGLMSGEEFVQCATDPGICARFGIPSQTAEGFLFPDTYQIPERCAPVELVERMTTRFFEVLGELTENAAPTDRPLLETVTVASIVQKETADVSEMSRISGVVYRRLERGMRLQCDVTIRYALKKYRKHLTYRDLDFESPYNSYLHNGLPPGPICCPGRGALEAAFRPDDSGYLYFVSKNDGTHHFSMTLAEHNRAVAKYQVGS
jgi:UPF0755 protein